LPELAERLVSNFLLAGKIAWGNTKSIATLFAGRYDPYEGIGCLIREFYDAVANGLPSPTPAQAVRQVARLTEDTINNAFQSAPAKYPISIPNETTVPSHLSADVLVTGGAGFIGTHLVRRLLSLGKGVRVVSRKKIEKSHFGVESGGKVQIVIGDLRDSKFVEYACSGVKAVYHLAAATKGDLFDQVESTCVGTKNLLKGIRDNQVGRLVYVSSVSILDQTSYPKNGIIDESFPLEPHPTRRGAYTYAKLQSEKLVQSFANEHKDIKVCIIRPGIVWGPGKRQELLETNFQLGGRLMIVLGQRKKRLPLVYVENLVDALIMAGNGEIETGECFNIVDDVNPTQGDYLKIMRNLTGRHRFTVFVPISLPLPLFWVAQKMLAHILRKPVYLTYQMRSKNNRVEYSVELAKKMLGFRSNVAFKEGLVRYQQWLNQIEE
jgi:nucleoside-diphosphate-sugar epimerase